MLPSNLTLYQLQVHGSIVVYVLNVVCTLRFLLHICGSQMLHNKHSVNMGLMFAQLKTLLVSHETCRYKKHVKFLMLQMHLFL